jgi:hypothetical protein
MQTELKCVRSTAPIDLPENQRFCPSRLARIIGNAKDSHSKWPQIRALDRTYALTRPVSSRLVIVPPGHIGEWT